MASVLMSTLAGTPEAAEAWRLLEVATARSTQDADQREDRDDRDVERLVALGPLGHLVHRDLRSSDDAIQLTSSSETTRSREGPAAALV